MEARTMKVLMEFHGLALAEKTWSEEYKGLETDDLLDQGVETDRGGTEYWWNYDAFCEQEELLNIIIEYTSGNDHYLVKMFSRDGMLLKELSVTWEDTIAAVLKKLNS